MQFARVITADQAIKLVAGSTEKPWGVDPVAWFRGDDGNNVLLVHGEFPLASFVENSEGDRYDGTVGIERAANYAQRASTPPPVVAALPRGDGCLLRIIDGGHRLTAARLKKSCTLPAIVRIRPDRARLLMEPDGQRGLLTLGWSIAFEVQAAERAPCHA